MVFYFNHGAVELSRRCRCFTLLQVKAFAAPQRYLGTFFQQYLWIM